MFYIKSFEKIFNIFSLIEDPFLLLFDWKKLNPLIMPVANLLCISFTWVIIVIIGMWDLFLNILYMRHVSSLSYAGMRNLEK